MKRTERSSCLIPIGILILTVHMSGCATQGQTGALAGSGIGALVGHSCSEILAGLLEKCYISSQICKTTTKMSYVRKSLKSF
jgi:hypothetical protein